MTRFDAVLDAHGKWVYITPIENLFLTRVVNQELQIEQVLFVGASKLPRIRKRLRIKQRISEIPKPFQPTFEKASVFAVVRQSGTPRQLETKCHQLAREAVHILSSSLLGYAKREFAPRIAVSGDTSQGIRKHILLNTENSMIRSSQALTRHTSGLVIEKGWRNFQERFFFQKLLSILNNRTHVKPPWRNNLRRVAVLVGMSLAAHDIAVAFLWNMIALEMLLTQQGEKYAGKYREVLPKRIEAFLGWVGFWRQGGFVKRINEVYSLRCGLVHDGNADGITAEHLHFTDNLLLSLLTNLVNYPKLFSSKEAVLEFTEKVAAERLLGVKPKVRPKRLITVSPLLTSSTSWEELSDKYPEIRPPDKL